MKNKIIMLSRISLDKLNKLIALGYKVFIHNPSANKRTPETNPKLPYDKPAKPTYIPVAKNYRIHKLYVEAWKKGILK